MSQLTAGSGFQASVPFSGAAYPAGWTHPDHQQPPPPPPFYQAQYHPKSAAPYAQSVPSPAPHVAPQRPTASSPPHILPNAARAGQPNSHTPPTQYPMAAPPLPQSPASQQQQQQQQTTDATVTSPKSPLSPRSQTREQQRVALLLSINVDLLEEVSRLQQDGRGGAMSAGQQLSLKNAGQSDKMAADEYIQCLRRVQANLTYMMPHAQPGQHESKIQPGPAYVTPPRHMPQLAEKYAQLKELFPGWQGMEHRMSQSSSSPSANAAAAGSQANGMNNVNA